MDLEIHVFFEPMVKWIKIGHQLITPWIVDCSDEFQSRFFVGLGQREENGQLDIIRLGIFLLSRFNGLFQINRVVF